MQTDQIYITANPTPNPDCLKFIVDRQLVDGEPVTLLTSEDAQDSPLARKLFDLGHVDQIFAFQNFITVTKASEGVIWQDLARQVGQVIREHLQTGDRCFAESTAQQRENDDGTVKVIKDILDEIRPAVAMDGGNIVFAGYDKGVVSVFMQGSCSGCPSSTVTLKAGIENRLRQVLPEIKEVVAI